MFLCIVESSLQYDDTCFERGTFRFREVCRGWDKVAVGFPLLWVRWAAGAVEAWPLFKARSKDAPVFVTLKPCNYWKTIPASSRDILADLAVSGRISRVDFVGTEGQLVHLLGAIDSRPPSNAPPTQPLIAPRSIKQDTQDPLPRFPPFSPPNLSELHIKSSHPDPSSTTLTTSNLTSLKLRSLYSPGPSYTLARLSGVLQKHPNLRELDLEEGTMPRIESSEAPVYLTLPHLIDLKLCGTAACILGFINLIGMSSPLHNVGLVIHYPTNQNVPAPVDIVKKILAAYYEREGLDYPRKADYLAVSSGSWGGNGPLVFFAQSRSMPAPAPQPILKLQLGRTTELLDILPLFPLSDTQEFIIEGLGLPSVRYYEILQMVEEVSHLRLTKLDVGPVLEGLSLYYNPGTSKLGVI